MVNEYDLIVIGSGTAGTTAANKCRSAGWKVAVIDQLPFGGTCALRGCDPKNVLIGAAEAVSRAHRMSGRGISYDDLKIDWPSLQAFKRTFTRNTPAEVEKAFQTKGIDTFHGHATFKSADSLEVGNQILRGKFILIASGSVPMKLNIEGQEFLTTSDCFLELDNLPKDIVLVGGGYIGFELAHLCRQAGAKVTILEQSSRLLGPFDRDLVEMLVKKSQNIGIDIHTNATVKAIKGSDGNFTVRASMADGEQDFNAGLVVHSAGRVPALDTLNLEAAGITVEKGRLKLNNYLQSISNPRIYAAGDAAGVGPALTPVATGGATIAAANMLEGNHLIPDYNIVASVVFSNPPLASVGLTEEKARQTGANFTTNFEDTSNWYSSRRVNEEISGFKVLIDKNTGHIIGAHILGPHAEEAINVFAIAMRTGISAKAIKHMLFAYPTAGFDITYML